jgi:glyoxylate reductase
MAKRPADRKGIAVARKKPLVVVTRKFPAPVEARMKKLFDVRLNADDNPMSARELVAAVKEADAIAPTVTDRIDAKLLKQAGPQLKIIANFGAGVNHVDLEAAAAKGIVVTNTPDVLTEDTADLTMALLLAAPRRLGEGERLLRAGKWMGWTPTFMRGHRVTGKSLGIVGMGRIGQAVAKRARGFDMSIHYHNRNRMPAKAEAALGATYWADLDGMLRHVDMVSFNCPYTPETHHLLSVRRLKLMKRTAYVVNTSRGAVIDEAALADALAAGIIAGAGLDVYEKEPKVHSKLRKLENVVLAPHLGSGTEEGRIAMGEKVVVNIKSLVDGHTPPDRVLPPR